ncbi:hypothetical protein V1525DRAFT_385322 [Lipomyces kononenkoae]|uniref:Uncharacterized protein n=1 Tax=Lipomyces kononenkoae TaxID=34357 RepID=A0ACC3T9Q6_LIPKO
MSRVIDLSLSKLSSQRLRRRAAKTLQHLKESAICHAACGHILSVLDHFTIEGPNGSHTCLVFPFAGANLAQVSYNPGQPAGSRRLRGSLARKLVWVNGQSAPKYLVEPANLSKLESKWFTEKALLVDFGKSFMLQTSPTNGGGIPMSYCAAELYFEGKASVWSDVWALGCTIFEIRAGEQLFASFLGGPHKVIRHIVQTLGKLPEPWWSPWQLRDAFFDDNGNPRKTWPNDIPMAIEYPLIAHIRDIGSEDNEGIAEEAALEDMKNIARSEPEGKPPIFESQGMRPTEAEMKAFDDLLHKVLRYKPE